MEMENEIKAFYPKSIDSFAPENLTESGPDVWGCLVMDFEDKEIYLDRDGKYFHNNTEKFFKGRAIRMRIPYIKLETGINLIKQCEPIFEKIVEFFKIDRHGSPISNMGFEEGLDEITRIVDSLEDEIHLMSADDYFQYGGIPEISSETTDSELEKISDELHSEAMQENYDIEDIYDYLYGLRDIYDYLYGLRDEKINKVEG